LGDASELEKHIVTSVQDFEKETFDGVKNGLFEAGKAVKLVPTLLKDCSNITSDLSQLLKMAEIFEHPLTLLYHIGKELIVNGLNIFRKISSAITAYKSGDYFHFGQYVGEALDEVFFKT
jgi:hypothetical protein